MIPSILEYEDGRVKVTVNAYLQPELKAIMDKYDMKADPYLAYVHLMTAVNGPYINIEEEEKRELAVYDVINTLGDFDSEDPLLTKAIEKLSKLNTSKTKRYYNSLGGLIDKVSKFIDTAEVNYENLVEINKMIKDAGATLKSYKQVEKEVDEEMKAQTRGDQEIGEY